MAFLATVPSWRRALNGVHVGKEGLLYPPLRGSLNALFFMYHSHIPISAKCSDQCISPYGVAIWSAKFHRAFRKAKNLFNFGLDGANGGI